MFSLTIPEMEIHMSNQPIALMITASGQIKPFKIKTKGKYFTLVRRDVRGIYTINNKYRYSWGKTPVYFYAAQETNVIDPVLINEINNYRKKNKLTELKRKDIRHGSRLRILHHQKKSIDELKQAEEDSKIELNGEIDKTEQMIDKRITDLREQHGKVIDPPDTQKTYVLLEHLKQLDKIDQNEYIDLMNKVESNVLTFDMLIDELREKHIVSVTEPLDENVEDFVQDLGAQNASDLAGFVDDLRLNKRGLKDMTPVPVKAFIPASVIFVIGLLVIIGVPVLASQWGNIEKAMAGGGGFKMPWDIFGGFIMHMPDFIGSLI